MQCLKWLALSSVGHGWTYIKELAEKSRTLEIWAEGLQLKSYIGPLWLREKGPAWALRAPAKTSARWIISNWIKLLNWPTIDPEHINMYTYINYMSALNQTSLHGLSILCKNPPALKQHGLMKMLAFEVGQSQGIDFHQCLRKPGGSLSFAPSMGPKRPREE